MPLTGAGAYIWSATQTADRKGRKWYRRGGRNQELRHLERAVRNKKLHSIAKVAQRSVGKRTMFSDTECKPANPSTDAIDRQCHRRALYRNRTNEVVISICLLHGQFLTGFRVLQNTYSSRPQTVGWLDDFPKVYNLACPQYSNTAVLTSTPDIPFDEADRYLAAYDLRKIVEPVTNPITDCAA